MPVKYIDRPDLPRPILDALTDPYYMEGLNEHFEQLPEDVRSKFQHHFSVTTLARPARQRVLFQRHSDKVLLDPLQDGFWRMFGHVIHDILQNSTHTKGCLVEKRLGAVIQIRAGTNNQSIYVHGQADLYDGKAKRIDDYKITKAEALYYENKEEYVFQLNALAYIFRYNGHPVNEIRNIYLFRNFDPRRYKDGGKYPKEQVAIIDIPIWSNERILETIKDKAIKHLLAEQADDNHLPLCSPKERWESETTYRAVKIDPKTGEPQKKAKFVSEVRMEVEDFIKANSVDAKGKPVNFQLVERPGQSVRCEYCEIAQFCEQRKAEVQKIMAEKDEADELPE